MTDNKVNEISQLNETSQPETNAQDKIKHSIKYKESRAKWARENREKRNELAKQYYKAKITTKPEYRDVLKERTKKRQMKLKEGQPTRPRGRPKKETPENTEKTIKIMGRPRKY